MSYRLLAALAPIIGQVVRVSTAPLDMPMHDLCTVMSVPCISCVRIKVINYVIVAITVEVSHSGSFSSLFSVLPNNLQNLESKAVLSNNLLFVNKSSDVVISLN